MDAAAVVSLVLGGALLFAPAGVGRLLGVSPDRRVLRTIGWFDLAVAPGLYFGRPQWPWLVARAASNPAIAVVATARARSVRARVIAAGLFAATALDLRIAKRLRSAEP